MKTTALRLSLLSALVALSSAPLASVASAQDRFGGTETVRPEAPLPTVPPGGRLVRLRVGDITQVHVTETQLFGDSRETAFYVPFEGRGLVTVVVEKKPGRRTYFIKAIAAGETVGGVVPRNTLDREGFTPKNEAEHARIQAALKAAPFIFVISPAEL